MTPDLPVPVTMAGSGGTAETTLSALLARVAEFPEEFDFFGLLRRVDALSPHRPRLGTSGAPALDALRIGQVAALNFPPAPLAGLQPGEGGRPPRLQTHLFGMFGPNGPLPLHLTEYAHKRATQAGDTALSAFMDLLHHRFATLFYRAWASGEPTVSHDRPQEDVFARQVAALAGYGMPSLSGRDAMPDLAKLHFTGRLAVQQRNPEGLAAILSSFFEVPVSVEEFAPGWVTLPQDALCRLGGGATGARLGSTVTLGRRVRLFQHRFRLRFGPMRLPDYERLLPGQPGVGRLAAIVRNYVGDELGLDLNLLLRPEDIPETRLGRAGRLGWTSWLGRRGTKQPADDLMFDPHAWAGPDEGTLS